MILVPSQNSSSVRFDLIALTTGALLGCGIPPAVSLPVESEAIVTAPECYRLDYSNPVRNPEPRMFPVRVELIPAPDSGAVIAYPPSNLKPDEWRAMTRYTWWKKLAPDSIEMNFSGNSEAIVLHLHRAGSRLVGRATYLSDIVDGGPNPSMRVDGTREACSDRVASVDGRGRFRR